MTEQGKKRKLAYIKKYQRHHYINVSLKLRRGDDDDVIKKLEEHKGGKSAYIKDLIRKDK